MVMVAIVCSEPGLEFWTISPSGVNKSIRSSLVSLHLCLRVTSDKCTMGKLGLTNIPNLTILGYHKVMLGAEK